MAPDGASLGAIYLNFVGELKREITEHGRPDIIICEQVAVIGFGGKKKKTGFQSREIMMGLKSHLHSFCETEGLEAYPLNIATLKKYATGSGRADKAEILRAYNRLFPDRPLRTVDHDIADAFFMMKWGMENATRTQSTEPQ